MKKLFLIGLMVLTSGIANAALSGDNSITGLLGFAQSGPNFGANFENRSGSVGLGGFFHYSSEKKDTDVHHINNHQTIAFGGLMYLHVLDNSDVDVYLAPGAAITMVKGITGQVIADDQTSIGPSWKIGAFWKLTSDTKIGLEQTKLVNWFTAKVYPDVTYTNFAITFGL